MCGGIKMLKHNVWTTLRLAYHGCKNLTHTSKTRQVKRTQMVATGRFTIRVCYFFRLLRTVAYTEDFHGGFPFSGIWCHLYLVFVVCDVTL